MARSRPERTNCEHICGRGRYGHFFEPIEDFRGYVDFFLLQDLVTDNYSAVKLLAPFEHFGASSPREERPQRRPGCQ
jgi:hypothetical protein